MNLKKKIICIVGILFVLTAIIVVGKKFVEHEKWQTGQISILLDENALRREEIVALNAEIADLEDKVLAIEAELNSVIEYDPEGFNYLAIGNSITKHPKCDYWWNEIGMAATSEEKDFVHIVSSFLEEEYENSVTYAVCYAIWEMQSNDRAETYDVIDPYLSPYLDLVTIQLGENVSDVTTFERDFEELIKYVASKCPETEIIIVDDFWSHSERRAIKVGVVEEFGLPFADLTEIRDNPEYRSELGAVVYGDDGDAHVVEHEGVAIHPGDAGMQYIADTIIELLQ